MEIVEDMYASDFTKKTLEQFGWKDGDAIPAELGQLMLSMKETLPASTRIDVLIDKEKMSPEQVEKVTAMIKEAKAVAKAKKDRKELDAQTATMAPGVAEAYKQFVEEAPQIIDDRAETNAVQPDNKETPQSSPAPANNAVEDTQAAESVPDLLPVTTFCPRCGWDMRMKFDVVPTDRDKEDFLATLLGGSRFKKRYELFGGKVVVTFRSVLAEENKLIYRQLVQDQQNGTVNTEAEWFVQLMDYRLACSLDTITDKNGKVLSSVPELDMTASTKDKTGLVEQLDMINKNILAQEATRRLVGMHLRQFQRLIEAIEAMAVEPSFWNGIE
jgi:hypothetical protein